MWVDGPIYREALAESCSTRPPAIVLGMGKSRPVKTIAHTNEFALIAALRDVLPLEPDWVKVGRGQDDCAVLDLGGRNRLVWTCDAQVEGVHFRRDWLNARQLGRRAASVNLSDIAAMGAQPVAALASLQLPTNLPERDYKNLMRGIGEQLAKHGASLVGGNLTRGPRLTVDLSLLGRAAGHDVAGRGGARVGDRILVSGFPGEAAAGLDWLSHQSRRKDRAPQPVKLRRRWTAPTPRVAAGQLLLRGGVTSMIDISDGLQADLGHLCDTSHVDAEIYKDQLPVSTALRRYATTRNKPAWQWVLGGGEDYELLCTAPARCAHQLQAQAHTELDLVLTDIGHILEHGQGRWLRDDTHRQRLSDRGHRHFG